ncbi:hypothetical protein B566_EDAN017452 [Ephemera danica]|nr:hypothetical protein B566_EDAN017452 [Ephemera danica]
MALIEGMPGELDIFERPVLQTGIIGGNWYQYKPTAVVTDAAQLEFRIPGQGDHYVDLSRSLFNVKIKILKADNTPYAATDVIAPSNNLLDTLFSDVKVEFNQKQISDSRNMYHYRAYLEDLFNFNNTSKETHQTASLWFQDEADKFDNLDNSALLARKEFSDEDLSAHEQHWCIQEQGNLRLELGTKTPFTEAITMIVYAEFREVLEIDKNRDISIEMARGNSV